ncbi:MAG: dephospho-CoA kinase [Cyanobacteria bacterium]|nr:dephospho-CoA kinase [Cyanobacteria bacterium bin.51]
MADSITSASQRRIGLTGGIASGKSSVGRILGGSYGLPLLDADAYARDVLAPGTAATQAVLARYGDAVQAPVPVSALLSSSGAGASPGLGGQLDRAALGHIVFADPAERFWLERLVHPLVRSRFEQALAQFAAAPCLVLMIPLLYEVNLQGLCSEAWLVDCDEEQQLQRLIQRDGCSNEEARARINAQWPLARKRGLADVLIDNRGGEAELIERVRRHWLKTGCCDSISPAASP